MPRRIALAIGLPRNREESEQLTDKVRVAEQVGVEAVFSGETWGHDQFTFLTQLAMQTERIQLGTGIAPVYGRSPAMLAMTSASLDEISDGHMILGLGTSGARVIEHWHGEPFDRPLQRLREYIEIIKLILADERLVYNGEIFQMEIGFRLDFEPVRKKIPIYVTSIAPKPIEQIGEVADGWMPIYWPKSRYSDGLAMIREGAKRAGRDDDTIVLCPSVTTVIDDDAETARQQARKPIAFYIGRMGVFYARMLSRNGYVAEVEACQAAWRRHDPEGAAAAIPDAMVQETALAGSLDEVTKGLDELAEHGVDLPILSIPSGSLLKLEQVLGTFVNG